MAPYPSNRRCCHGHLKLERQCFLANGALTSLPSHHYMLPDPASSSTTSAAPVPQSLVITPYPVQMPLAMLQAYIRAPPVATRAFHSLTVPPATPATVPTILAAPPIRTDSSSGEGVENTETCVQPRPVPPHGPETESIAEQTGRVMGDSPLYGLAGVAYAPVEFAQDNPRDRPFQIPGRVLPLPATFFGVQSVPGADALGRFARICAPPHADVAAAMPRTGTRPS
ncbi:hypothetical protein FS749_003141 [Ceratobasidium sp. UAMH 11750]|nr:hypothetical protein FS749_003141 [Ceratobasidium sp. UAMH 11750]